MGEREALLACYRSGQMSAAQWERHCEDDPELRTMVEAKGGDANDRVPIQRRPEDTSPGVKTGATDPIAAMREALEECANDLAAEIENRYSGYGSESKNHPAISDIYRRDIETVARACAALVAYDAVGRAVKFGDDEMNEDGIRSMAEYRAAVGEPLLRRHATWQPEDDCRDKTVPEMVAHIYKNRKGLAVAPNGHTTPFLTVEEWSRIADFFKDYDFQPRQTSPGQSADVEAMARELALRFRRPFSSEKLIKELLSFAACAAADQRERDAKIAETPDPQLANKTAAQIAAAIRASAKPF